MAPMGYNDVLYIPRKISFEINSDSQFNTIRKDIAYRHSFRNNIEQ